jgi:hypothetical protein
MSARITWFEVLGQDQAALQSFYAQVFGWTLTPQQTPLGTYATSGLEQTGVQGGIGQAPEGPGWSIFYVDVADLDATIAAVQAQGGAVRMPPTTLPECRIAVVADPEGHLFGLSQMTQPAEA